MGRNRDRHHLLLLSNHCPGSELQDITRRRLLRGVCPYSRHRDRYYMADIYPGLVLCLWCGSWPGITWT